MRTLFITVDPAFPPISGVELRNSQNARAASRLGPVLIASLVPPTNGDRVAGIEMIGLSDGDAALLYPRTEGSTDIDVNFPSDAVGKLEQIARSFCPDVIIAASLPMHPLVAPAKALAPHVVVDFHNVESHLIRQQSPRPFLRHFRDAMEVRDRAKKIAEIERRVVSLADRSWVCSAIDRVRLRRIVGLADRIRIVPNGIPYADTLPVVVTRPLSTRRGPTLLFFGHLGYSPNVAAALWLADLLPGLRLRLPAARLLLAGRKPHPDILALAQPGVIDVQADPPEAEGILCQADIAVLPIRQGGGTRFKVLEAMAWGIPVVATRRAVEGLNLKNGVHVRLAETSKAFCAQVCALADNATWYNAQAAAARSQALAHFGWARTEEAVRVGLSFAS